MGWEEYSIFVQTGGILTQMFFNSTFQRLNDERRAYVEKARLERLAIKARGAEESQHNELFPSPTNYEVDIVNEDEDVDEDDYVSNELCEDWCNSYYTSETMCIANESMSSHSNLDDLNESLKLVEGSATHVSPNSTNTTCTSVNPNSTNTTSDAAEYDNMTTNNPYINAVVEATIVETKSPALNIPEDTLSKWSVGSNCTEKIHENRSVPDQNAFTILSKDVDILNAKVSKGSQPYRVSMRSINPVQRDLVVAQNINTAYIILFAIILALVVGAMVYLLLYHWELFFPERTRFSKRYPNSPKYDGDDGKAAPRIKAQKVKKFQNKIVTALDFTRHKSASLINFIYSGFGSRRILERIIKKALQIKTGISERFGKAKDKMADFILMRKSDR